MSNENQNAVITQLHAQNFYKTIQEFLEFDTNTCIEVQNELLNSILQNENLSKQSVQQLVFYTTSQTSFLSKLKVHWENFTKFNNIKIENS